MFSRANKKYRIMAASTKERLDKHDREIAAIRTLLREGMRLVVDTRKEMFQMRKDMRTLNAMQNRTEASLQALIHTMRHGGNGHAKGSVS